MENASKALLIAGAILIVILLIAVGMLVYSQSRGVIDTGVAQMSSAEINTFNAQFANYSGTQDKTATKMLIQTIINNNIKYKDDKSKWVYCYITISYIEDGTRYYSGTGASKNVDYGTYEYFMRDLTPTLEYIDKSVGNKKFHVYINYNENGLVDYVRMIQFGAEDFANAKSEK